MSKERRDILRRYETASREIELAHVCITTLQSLNGATPARCIRQLQHYSQQALRRMDKAAAELGAPYPGAKP